MAAPGATAPVAEADGGDDERRMPFLAHLDELRSCLRNSAIAILLGTVVAYLFRPYLFALLARPFLTAWEQAQEGGRGRFVFLAPHEAFMVMLKLSFVIGLFVASPVVFRELWRFISPGLYARERRWG